MLGYTAILSALLHIVAVMFVWLPSPLVSAPEIPPPTHEALVFSIAVAYRCGADFNASRVCPLYRAIADSYKGDMP